MREYSLLVLALFVVFLFSCSGDIHDAYISGRNAVGVARVMNHYFPTIQDAINYVCGVDYTENKGLDNEDETVHVLVSQYTGPSIVIPSCEKTVVIDFNNCVYTFEDSTKTAVRIEECSKVTINNATFVINRTNEVMEYVYWINSDYSQDCVRVVDNRGVTQENCGDYVDSQKVYIAEGKDVSFGNSSISDSVNVTGWLTVNSLSDLSLVSGSYTFWAIYVPDDGTAHISVEDDVTIRIFSEYKDTLFSYIDGLSAVEVVLMDNKCPHTNYQTVERPATCTREGRTWKQCTACGTCLETIEKLPKLPHDYSTEWTTDTDFHWHECENCGEDTDKHTHNRNSLVQDGDKGHHWECTVCGYKTETEAHSWGLNNICTVCGYKKSSGAEGAGFSISVVMPGPNGYLTYDYPDEEVIVSFHECNDGDYKSNKFEWYLFDKKQDETGSCFVFVPFGSWSHVVKCVFSNDYGVSSATMVVSGK